ncbi:MAG: ATP phosphoribosyltransferase regulatory subunit [Firmicutes bacterium ADurb.Bin419]|nr:MAG: ATP phosphoribosyltransferase regulatory subunit [Firmicutes bacterium ADurb.Bin419]
MTKWKIYTPEGVQDVLVNECFVKRNIEEKVRNVFRSSGFYEVETPIVEFYDAFLAEDGITAQETMFKFFDQQGRILVLRPEITIPIARLAATKYKDYDHPLRFCYIGNTFNYKELGGGKQKEFTQSGVELLGINSPEADAEVIATAINAVRAAGLENFQIDIGQVDFFKGLMEETGLTAEETEQMRILIDRKDYLAVEELVKTHNIREDLKELVLSLPRLFGSLDVIETVEKYSLNEKSINALENLRRVLKILEDYELSKYVSIDLGMVQSLNYYTGIIFRGFTYGAGFPILSGGRYDKLVEKFGKVSPATGFSLGINMVMMALERQKVEAERPAIDSLICYKEEGRKTAFKVCQALRDQGLVVEIDVTGKEPEDVKEYARIKGIGGIIRILDDRRIEVVNIEKDETSTVTIDELLGR